MKVLFTFLLIFFTSLIQCEEIEVLLRSKTRLCPTYIRDFTPYSPHFTEEYWQGITETIRFDISNNGFCSLCKHSIEKEEIWKQFEFNEKFPEKIHTEEYLIKPEKIDNRLSIVIYHLPTQTEKRYTTNFLTGDLRIDRKQVHALCDQFCLDFFGKKGIANTRLLYSVRKKDSETNQWISEVWASDYDGENAVQMTYENEYAVSPCFIPSRTKPHTFMFVSYKKGQSKIFFAPLYQPDNQKQLDLRGNQLLPAISRNCDKLAFISDAAGRADLFLQYIDTNGRKKGKPIQLFSYPRATQASPTFDPSGTKLAFVSDKNGPPRIYFIEIPQTNRYKRPKEILITRKNRQNTSPSWSPDGKKLAFTAKTNGVRQIWIYNFETKEERQLTKGPKHKENPSWAPDSLHLVYNSESENESELYLIHLHQNTGVKITKGPGQKRFPSWEPGPIAKK